MRRFWILAILIGISSSFLWSCENQKGDKATFESMQAMRKEISDLRLRIFKLEISKEAHKTVVLDPSEKGYQRLDTNYGMFLISLHEIKPYLDGCKVAINIGNPTNVLYSGFKAKVKWGKRWEEGINYDDWVKQLREKEESFTEELKPGWWNKAVVTVSPAKPDQLGYLEFSIETNNAKLFDNRK